MLFFGEICALGTAVSWSANSIFCTEASHRIGSFSMNHYRMLFGVIFIMSAHLILRGTIFPYSLSSFDVLALALSGFLGYFICDAFLFQCYVDLTPRLGILAFSFYPFASAFLARIFLGEILSFRAWAGMVITLAGIVFVLLEKKHGPLHLDKKRFQRGLLFASGAVTFQALSFVIAKPIMTGAHDVDSLSATLIRAIAGFLGFWLVSAFRGRIKSVLQKTKNLKAMLLVGCGSIIGPFIGVWLSMAAIKNAPIGIASTLMALMPIAIIPMSAIVYKEKVTLRSVVGAAISCAGVALLFKS
jgi:drug/metabolite transporter (DMT)-like permease